MKTRILKYGAGDQKLAGKITLEAETREEEELLDFMHAMSRSGGLVPTVDILLETEVEAEEPTDAGRPREGCGCPIYC